MTDMSPIKLKVRESKSEEGDQSEQQQEEEHMILNQSHEPEGDANVYL
jgi:hypothetical protein